FSDREVRVARKVARRDDRVLNMDAVHAMEAVPRVVERKPELPAAADRFDLERERIETRVGADLDSRPFRMLGRCNLARAGQPAGEIDPAVRPEGRMTHPQLRRAVRIEAGQQHAALVGAAIAVSVFKENYVRRAGDDESAVPRSQAVRES